MPHLIVKRASADLITYSLLVHNTDKVNVRVKDGGVKSAALGSVHNQYQWDVVVEDAPHKFEYNVNGQVYAVQVPGRLTDIRVLYTSCNKDYIASAWDLIASEHAEEPYNIHIGGGDQLYCDELWDAPVMKAWCSTPMSSKMASPMTSDMYTVVAGVYERLYESKFFKSPEHLNVLPSIPSILMWDDHDIFDGYGSYPDWFMHCPVILGVYAIARKYFCLYQLHMIEKDEAKSGRELSGYFTLGNTLILNIDTRTDRRRDKILHPETYARIDDEIAKFRTARSLFPEIDPRRKSILVCLSTPAAYFNMENIEKLLEKLPDITSRELLDNPAIRKLYNQFGMVDVLDDMADGWGDYHHTKECNAFMNSLFNCGVPVTLIVGDAHIGARGLIQDSKGRSIDQYISSGVGNRLPPMNEDLLKLCPTERVVDGMHYSIDRSSLIHNYNWGKLVLSGSTGISFEAGKAPEALVAAGGGCCTIM